MTIEQDSKLHYPFSQRTALRHRLELLGYSFGKTEMDGVYERLLTVADTRKVVENEDLVELLTPMRVERPG